MADRSEIISIGGTYRSEASKSFSKALAFAAILIFTHLLDVNPSEISTLGLNISIPRPEILYGTISLLYIYYLSRALDQSENGYSPYLINLRRHNLKTRLLIAKNMWKSNKKNKNKPIDFSLIKKQARRVAIFNDVVIFPYYIISIIVPLISLPIALIDIYHFCAIAVDLHLANNS
ncbi:hypothetical protein [Sphingopyxis sp.]|uniref:hypothetical protein n=1 Tax=Sphingopyxis sp. TaxID=1908224 RepID=UPI002FC969D8